VAGEYYIFITAHSAGYHDVTKKKKIIVLDCIPMQGQLDIGMPADVVKGESVQFIAMGITSPVDGNVTYQWYAPDFAPDSYTGGNVFTTTAPSQDRTYMVTVVARAENYCDTSIQKMIPVKPGRKMQGMFDFTPFPPVIKGQKVTFAAHGITTPTAEHIEYDWLAAGFTAGTVSGNSYTAICPSTTGTYDVAVTAKAAGYADSTVRRHIPVGDELPMTGNVSISVPHEVITAQPATFYVTNNITIPSEGISFVWDAPYFEPSTYQSAGNTFTATPPATQGIYPITVTAKAANYSGAVGTATVTVKGGKDMTGILDFHEPNPIVKDLEATFTVNSSLATSDDSPITYKWTAPGFAAATFGGPTFTGISTTAGTRTITLSAEAPGYTTVNVQKTIDVSDGLDMGNLTILVNGANGISSPFNAGINTIIFSPEFATLPTSPVTYTWTAPGCTPDPFTGEQYQPTLPPTAGNYIITLTASATGYQPKQVSLSYTIDCNPMTIGFNLSRTALLVGDKTVLSVNPPSPPVPGISYTWTIPAGFDIVAGSGSSITPSVTIKAPATALNDPATLTLTAKATNYCEASHTATVTVKDCYPATFTPFIESITLEVEEGVFHASNLQNVMFTTLPVTPLRSGGTVTYAWDLNAPSSSRSFTPSNSSAATSSATFTTKAPGHSSDTYTLTLQVAADGYCPFAPVLKPVVVDPSKGALTGTIKISEAVAPTSDPTNPVLWIAKDRPVTLHAHYSAGSGEATEELALRFRWYWINGANSTLLDENDGTFIHTPPTEVTDHIIRVEVYDLNGKASTANEYPYYVQNCSDNDLPGLHINVNYQCRVDGLRTSAYVMDSLGNNYIYQVTKIGSKWWTTENLRANKQNNAYTAYIDTYGAYYHAGLVSDLGQTDGKYCPKGWRIPTQSEWNNLNSAISSTNSELVFQGLATAKTASSPSIGDDAWNSTMISNLPGSNAVGFNLTPAGFYYNSTVTLFGLRALFFIHGGSQIQVYGNTTGSPGNGTATAMPIESNWWYTARCVND
jgi:uncharacterized protein (TIGR02145 family)